MGGEESPRSAAHAEGGQQGPELEGPVGTPLWGADSWPGPAALWAALLGWRASRGPLGWGAAERQHPGVGWGSQRRAVLCPSAPALVGGPAGQAGPASWAGSLRVKASAPSRSPSGPFFHLTPETQRLSAEGPGTASGPGAGVGVGVVGAPPSLSTPGGGVGVPPSLGEDRPASRPPWGRGCPFFALQGPAQAEREAPGLTVWRTPQTSPCSGAPIPAPRRRVPGRPSTRPTRPLQQRWGEPGPAQHPWKSRPPWGCGSVSRVTQAPRWSSPWGPPGGGFVRLPLTPHPVPSAAGHTPSTPRPPRCPGPLWSPGEGPVGAGLGAPLPPRPKPPAPPPPASCLAPHRAPGVLGTSPPSSPRALSS